MLAADNTTRSSVRFGADHVPSPPFRCCFRARGGKGSSTDRAATSTTERASASKGPSKHPAGHRSRSRRRQSLNADRGHCYRSAPMSGGSTCAPLVSARARTECRPLPALTRGGACTPLVRRLEIFESHVIPGETLCLPSPSGRPVRGLDADRSIDRSALCGARRRSCRNTPPHVSPGQRGLCPRHRPRRVGRL